MIFELNSSSDPRANEVLNLAHTLFPRETLEPDERLRDEIDGIRSRRVRFFVWDEGGVRGFIRMASVSAGKLILHLGVDPAWQGRGVGSRLLEAAQNLASGEPVFAEVESGLPMSWWCGKGAKIVWAAYLQPALHPDTEPVELALMALGTVANPKEAVRSIYRDFYGRRQDDPLIKRVLEGRA